MTNKRTPLRLGAEVEGALGAGKGVVALESTIITHGMPYPQNLEMAQGVEALIRDKGAIPATIAIMDGHMHAGLDAQSLERLAREGHGAAKASRRDLAALLAKGQMAGTTVATTMYIAHKAGIAVFATGGIGGVHRGASETFDISADLRELAQTPVAVVCAGAKSLLDLPKTLEVLETHGVPVLGYKTDDFPAFYVRSSGLRADHRFDDARALAAMVKLQFEMGLGGVVVGNPIPAKFELDPEMIERTISQAIHQANEEGISGKDITPFLLQRIFEITKGESLTANIALVRHNAEVAADLALALAEAAKG